MEATTSANPIILSSIPLEELLEKFKIIVQEGSASREKLLLDDKLLSSSETCSLFKPKISRQTLHAWSKSGKIPIHRIGGRSWYKYSEVLSATNTIKKYKK